MLKGILCAVGSHGNGEGMDSYEQLGRGTQRCNWKVASGFNSLWESATTCPCDLLFSDMPL